MKQQLLLSVLLRQLAAAQRCQLPAHEVAQILAQDPQWTAAGRRDLAQAAQALRGHILLSEGLAQLPDLMPKASTQLLRAAELGGVLPATLDTLAADYRHQADGARDLRLALAWPLLVAGVVVAMLVLMSIFVMPAFQEAYASFNADLPPVTALFLSLTLGLGQTWWLWGTVVLGLLLAWQLGRLPKAWGQAFGRVWQSIGFVQHQLRSRFTVRLLRWLQLSASQPALAEAALAHLQATETSAPTAAAAQAVARALRGGSSLAASLAQAPLLPTRLSLFAQLGERMGDMPSAIAQMTELALAQEEEATRAFERGALLLLYGAIASVVATTLIAVYLPIFKFGAIV